MSESPPPNVRPPESLPVARVDVDRLLDKRPPLPPEPSAPNWIWTKDRLKAVYLDAFTNLEKAAIAEAVGVSVRGLFEWRRAPDYRRYLAALIAADGLADRAERVKARKGLAQTLEDRLTERMKNPNALDGEKLSSILRAHRELVDSLAEDSEALRQSAEAAGPMKAARPDLDLVARIAAIPDPAERETVKRHLLELMRDYIDAPRVMSAAPVVDVTPEPPEPTQEPAGAPPEPAPSAPESQDLDGFEPAPEPSPSAPQALSASDLE